MKVYRSLEAYEAGVNPVATIGTYDGVHQGHKVILERLKDAARALDGESVVISFHPHPRLVLFPEDNPLRLLQTIDEKIELLDQFGIDKLLLIPFTKEFSRLTSEDFIKHILVETVGIHRIIIGYDHHFGKNREGSLQNLLDESANHNYAVEEIPPHQVNDANVSSTKIRKALLAGKMNKAASFLGYNYRLTGEVIHGEKRGRTIGFPTANIRLDDPWKLIPGNGVYFVKVHLEGQGKSLFGMMNIGVRPTFTEGERSLEVHIFDFQTDIYEQNISVTFLEKIRGEKKFNGIEELRSQLQSDQSFCREKMAAIEAKG